MAEGKNAFKNLMDDLGIDYSDMETNPKVFCRRVYDAAMNLSRTLDEKQTDADIQRKFREKATKDEDAIKEAQLAYDAISKIIHDLSPAAVANLLPMMSEITSQMNNVVKTAAYRESDDKRLSKKYVHEMYINLKKFYEVYVNYLKLFNGVKENFPIIPAKSGNYSNGATSSSFFIVEIDGEPYWNPYRAAKVLGLEIDFYTDLIEIVKNSDGKIGDHNVRLTN